MQIWIGADHAGVALKDQIKNMLEADDHEVTDQGAYSDESVDYPDFAASVAQGVSSGSAERGILVCGTGIGMAIAANKVSGVRAAVCHDLDTVRLSRQHNQANVLALGARTLAPKVALSMVREWLQVEFEGGRHGRRVRKITSLER